MSELAPIVAIVAAWISGFCWAGMLDSVWGFTEWSKRDIVYLTFFWSVLGFISILLVVE